MPYCDTRVHLSVALKHVCWLIGRAFCALIVMTLVPSRYIFCSRKYSWIRAPYVTQQLNMPFQTCRQPRSSDHTHARTRAHADAACHCASPGMRTNDCSGVHAVNLSTRLYAYAGMVYVAGVTSRLARQNGLCSTMDTLPSLLQCSKPSILIPPSG